MNNKILSAKLKEDIRVAIQVDGADFNKDMLSASRIIENLKVTAFLEIKQKMHEKIATLSLEDIKFDISN